MLAAVTTSPSVMVPVLAQQDEPRIQISSESIGEWISNAFDYVGTNFWEIVFWVVIFSVAGGWTIFAVLGDWIRERLPHNRRKALERAERKRVAQQRELELDAEHAKHCACGERCDGRVDCEEHHPDCNCDHRGSFCVCQDEDVCDCDCRCDCKECEGYFKDEPLRRVPHDSTRAAAARRPTAPSVKAGAAGSAAKSSVSWSQARERFLKVCEEYTAFECDPVELVRLPALADVTFAPTGVFVEAFFQANQLLTPTEPSEAREAQRFVDAAQKACNAWRQAVEAAERVRDSRLGEEERLLLRRAARSLKLADRTESAEERVRAQESAAQFMNDLARRTEASGTWRLPEKARLEIASWHRPQLEAGKSVAE